MKIYALVDGCNAPDLLSVMEECNVQSSCLFNPPLQVGMEARAPYLIEINESFKTWLAQLTDKPWGLYLISDKTDFMGMRKHLRQYTYAKIPIEEKPVFFRFYDPRVFWRLTDILDDQQLHAFMGPIDIVATSYEGYRQDYFGDRRSQFSNQLVMKDMFLTLSEFQYQRLEKTYEDEYIEELYQHMMKHVDPNIIEEMKKNSEGIHREMLEHERDIKGSDINHEADQSFLLDQNQKTQARIEQAFFSFSKKTGQWQKIRGEKVEKVIGLLGLALNKIAKNPISEAEFHEKTNHQYIKESQEIDNNQNKSVDIPDYLKEYGDDPYFYQQNGQWFYVAQDKTAYPINDERIEALRFLNKEKVFEDDFHKRTKYRYEVYRGLAYIPEIKVEEDVFRVTTIEELKETIYSFSRDLYDFCWENTIEDERSIRALSELFAIKSIFRIKDIPEKWINSLIETKYEGFFRAEKLVIDELGYMPK